ncbi:MAG: [Clostridia bacterium]|nr:[FeFe] hydrogenase H-cluster maturation GTPase HydF [Clostridia bacterium]
MSLNSTPSGERLHIAFFGLRNAGKSSLVNAVTNQKLSVVSDVPGTTTDPVKKAMELLPLGPVLIIDTPGFDDEGTLGALRVETTRRVLAQSDIAVLVLDAAKGATAIDEELLSLFRERRLPFVIAYNKADTLQARPPLGENALYTSALTGENIEALKNAIGALCTEKKEEKYLVRDLLSPGDMALLVIPIDKAAPKGRLILPQQQVMRDLLDGGIAFVTCRETELAQTLDAMKTPPQLVITDSQVFSRVAALVPESVPLTSFSILFARYKGNLFQLLDGANALSRLQDGDTVLISEGCTHHRQCGDIGTEKMPAWIKRYTQKNVRFAFTSGGDFPEDLSPFALVVHCGGCMLNEREMHARLDRAAAQGVPIVNYGMAIAEMHGILKRSVEVITG